jgi:hypothetical protein
MAVVARDDPLHPGDRSTCPFATADATLDTLPNPGDEGTSPLAPPPAPARWREEEPVRRISVSVTGPRCPLPSADGPFLKTEPK